MSDSNTECISASDSCHFTCPSGGTWYVCPDEPYFVGCCSSDPCTNTNTTSPCPSVAPASFDPSIYHSIRPNSCVDSPNANWYTCNFTSPPFLGCCASNACGQTEGCPEEDVLAAAWSSSRDGQFVLFQDEDGGGSDDNGDGDGGLSGGAIAGIIIGAVIAVVIALVGIWFLIRRSKNKKNGGGLFGGSTAQDEQQAMYTGEYGHPGSPYRDSQFSSPAGTTIDAGTGKGAKYLSGSSAGFSLSSLSPPLPSEHGRSISEIHSQSGSDEYAHHQRGSSQSYGLGVFGAQKPETIAELDSTSKPAAVYELDARSRS